MSPFDIEEDEGPDGRCEIDPIAALREDDSHDRSLAAEAMGMVRGSRRNMWPRRYSAKKSVEPDWQKDPSKLPKKPPQRKL